MPRPPLVLSLLAALPSLCPPQLNTREMRRGLMAVSLARDDLLEKDGATAIIMARMFRVKEHDFKREHSRETHAPVVTGTLFPHPSSQTPCYTHLRASVWCLSTSFYTCCLSAPQAGA